MNLTSNIANISPSRQLQIAKLKNLKADIGPEANDKKMKEASKDFETLFVNQMYGEMRKSVESSGFIKQSQGEKIFREMLDNKYAKMTTEKGGFGLADAIYNQLKVKK